MASVFRVFVFLVYVWLSRAEKTTGLSDVKLDQATVVGTVEGAVERFLGIPYARAP